MSIVVSINRFLDLIAGTLRQVGQGRIWLLLIIWAAVNWLVLYGHYSFVSPVFFGIIRLWVTVFGERQAALFAHYPDHLVLLPYVYGWARLALGLVFEGFVLGAAAMLFFHRYEEGPGGEAVLARAARLWVHLAIGWAVINGLMLLAGMLLPDLFDSMLRYSPRRRLAFDYVLMPALYTVILALFYFVIPSIAVLRDNVFEAFGRSLRIFVRAPFTCLFLAFLVLVLPVLLAKLVEGPADIVVRFRPELVYWLLLGGILADLLANFFWMGTAARYLVSEEA